MKRVILVLALTAAPVFADDVYLRGGGRFSGEIVEQTADFVTVDIGGGVLRAPMDSVVRIETGTSALQEYRQRAAMIPDDDAEAWRELARWAQRQALSTQAWDAWSKVVAVLPDDEEANRALDRVRLDGRWVTEDEAFRAQGYVKFEGQWMTPAKQQQILDERSARAQEEERANQREIQAIEAEIDEQRQRENEEFERRRTRYDNLPEYDPTTWGWGSGPSTWPTAVVVSEPRDLAAPQGATP